MAIWTPSESWEKTFYLEAMLWEDIKEYIERAIQHSNTNNTTVQIEFNWIRLPKITQETKRYENYINDLSFYLIKEYKESAKWIEKAPLRKKEIIEKVDYIKVEYYNIIQEILEYLENQKNSK